MGWKAVYQDEMAPGQKRNDQVLYLLKENIDGFLFDVKGYGADTSEVIPESVHERHAPDIEAAYKGRVQFKVEVTGTDRMVPPILAWILEGKYRRAFRDAIPVWFWHVSDMGDNVIRDVEIGWLLTEENCYILDETPKGFKESYIHIPFKHMSTPDALYSWAREILCILR